MIEQTYNCEEQMHLLVIYIIEQPKDKVLKFCVCLRKMNTLLADFVQFRSQSDSDIDKAVKEEENTKIKSIVGSYFASDTSKSVCCEDVHILIDEKRKCFTRFESIKACVMEMFPDVSFKENDSQFHGLTWSDESNCTKRENEPEDVDENLSDMPSDKFSQYMNIQMEKCRTGIGSLFETTTLEECISSDVFANLTPEQLEEIFSPKMKEANIKFGYGIRTALSEIQKNIKRHMIRSSLEKNNILRKFDTPPETTVYTRCTVRPPSGNLLAPVHEFVLPRSKGRMTCTFMGKEVVRFATACINGKKNDTIHFGIKYVGNGNGEIVGLSNDALILGQNLNLEIRHCIRYCFEQATVSVAERCILPVQIVPVEDNRLVLEVDVVSFSSHVQKEIIGIMFPPKGNQRKKYFVYRENMIATIEQSRLGTLQTDIEKLFLERVHQLYSAAIYLDAHRTMTYENMYQTWLLPLPLQLRCSTLGLL
ncbi:uncharacterized protein LOC123540082 isoform X2 [Mercenaria mercenaria]|uniref:uncharacterized protein LOC123540082 isoform X2 n=1 Tax=Mercenaria mercenaria TaxID=6596 RepID=UPI00234E6FD2|nr:uncharacterized protein LOC123540082 isoform X2 [Mercenaria mercenaria]